MRLRLRVVVTSIIVFCLLTSIGQNQQLIHVQEAHAADETTTTYWLNLARNAWEYFQPGKGVNEATGLHNSGAWFPYFTDWDLGVYVQAIIDAEKLGVINDDGDWGSNARFNKILKFLETRPRTTDGQPYIWYSSGNGQSVFGDHPQNVVEDAGKLLLSLKKLKLFKPDLAARIDNVVYNLHNYTLLKNIQDTQSGSTSIYKYYSAMGFAGFWPERFSSVANAILDNIMGAPTVSTYGVTLPQSLLSSEPLLLSVLELQPDPRLQNLAKQVISAHEARSAATGKYVAFSEGNTELSSPEYVYEWVVLPDGQTWVQQASSGEFVQIPEIIYLKAAVGFLAIYNTTFTRNMVDSVVSQLESALPWQTAGYGDGVDENGRAINGPSDKTNSLIISAARYAIENAPQKPQPSPSPSPSPTSPSPTPTPATDSSTSPGPSNSPDAPPSTDPSPSIDPNATVDSIEPMELGLIALVVIVGFSALIIPPILRSRKTRKVQSFKTRAKK